MRRGITGEYDGRKLRSLNELIYAVYLDKVLNVNFRTEPFSLKSKNSDKRKIPDFVFDSGGERLTLVEVKGSRDDVLDVITDYATNEYACVEMFDVKFIALDRHAKKTLITEIVEVIGKDKWKDIEQTYRKRFSESGGKVYGFPGSLNGRFGRVVSEETRKKIGNNKPDQTGDKNPNFGNVYSEKTRKAIGAKWSDEDKKRSMKRKGMITHLRRMNEEQYQTFVEYATAIINGKYGKRPDFLNRSYTVTIEKINDLFDNEATFFSLLLVKFDRYEEMFNLNGVQK